MSASRALIGHTGFVGSNLMRQRDFSHRFNSSNIEEMRGRRFDEVWCAGVQAVKWWANANPEQDRAGIAPLLDVLATVEAERFMLISTVDVFGDPNGRNEDDIPDRTDLHAYGLHRLEVEDAVIARFPEALVVRLPGLYGRGLKKNVIYDLLHDNALDNVHADAVFQFYGLDPLADDVERAQTAGLSLVHLVPEPVRVEDVARQGLGRPFDNRPDGPPPRYDLRTRNADLWGRADGYVLGSPEVLAGIKDFAAQARADMATTDTNERATP